LKTNREESVSSLFDVLALVSGGRATVTMGGLQFIEVDGDKKTLEVEAAVAKQAGLSLSSLSKLKGGPIGALTGPISVAGVLSQLGWRLTLRTGGEVVLSMGKGSPRFTGRITLNPLKTRKLLKVLS
jgi:hypothetical protein